MAKKRIIPCLDIKDGRVVKGIQFLALRDAGDPVAMAQAYEEQGADELVTLDISATNEGRETMVDVVCRVAAVLTIPLIVGGGIHAFADMKRMLDTGAAKVSVGTAALQQPDLLTEGAKVFGSDKIVAAIDAKYDDDLASWRVYTHGGKQATAWDVCEWAKEAERHGAGEILLTSMDQDGEKNGFDLALTKKVKDAVDVPVIASGGAGATAHFTEVFEKTKVDAALAASIFHFGETSIPEVKETLQQKGMEVG